VRVNLTHGSTTTAFEDPFPLLLDTIHQHYLEGDTPFTRTILESIIVGHQNNRLAALVYLQRQSQQFQINRGKSGEVASPASQLPRSAQRIRGGSLPLWTLRFKQQRPFWCVSFHLCQLGMH
jgi:hypothetical protein